MDKLDYKKVYKDLYCPKAKPSIITVPSMHFALIEGKGDPNGEQFALATAALYGFSYAVKMSYKSKDIPVGFFDYAVFPLEGEWDLVDKSKSAKDKSNYAYTIMIRQPDFLTDALFERFKTETKMKKDNDYIDRIRYEKVTEGLCCQMLHVGSYDSETASFDIMRQYCTDCGYERISQKHKEIYLSDPRKTEMDKLKTVLRFKIAEKA